MSLPLIYCYMEPIIKETQVIRDHGGWEGKTNTKANWALGLGIGGLVLGGAALAKQGGLNGLLGGAAPAAPAVVVEVRVDEEFTVSEHLGMEVEAKGTHGSLLAMDQRKRKGKNVYR